MKKKIISVLLTAIAVFGMNTAIAHSELDAYINGDRIFVETGADLRDAANAAGVFVFYDKDGVLCGAALSERVNNAYYSALIADFDKVDKIRIWVADKGSDNKLYTLNITEKPAPTSSPAPVSSAAPSPTAAAPSPEPTPEEQESDDEAYYDNVIDYGGDFYEGTQTEARICGILIDCSTALAYDGIDNALISQLPEDGIMVPYTEIEITKGMTVFDVLEQAADMNGVTISGDSSYVSGINGLSEFSCGALSGWLYSVNGEFPSVPIGEYQVSENDEIAILYTCDLGDDL